MKTTIHLIDAKGAEIAIWQLHAVPGLPQIVQWAGTARYFARIEMPTNWPTGTPKEETEPRYRECAAPVVIGVL